MTKKSDTNKGNTVGLKMIIVPRTPLRQRIRTQPKATAKEGPPPYYICIPHYPLPPPPSLHSEQTKTEKETQNGPASGKKDEPTAERNESSLPVEKTLKNFLERKVTSTDFTKKTQDIIEQASEKTEGATEALKEFCYKTTAHGFSHIVENDVPFPWRVFWVIITLTGFCFLVSAGYNVTFSAFVTRRPTTEVEYTNMHSTGMRIPHMTICCLSGFWKTKMEEHEVNSTLGSYILLSIRGMDIVNPTLDHRMKRLLKDDLDSYLKKKNKTLEEMLYLLSPRCEDVIKGCFRNNIKSFSAECCNKYFDSSITSMGVCYSTLSRGMDLNLNQSVAGLIGGYRIFFTINSHEYMDYDPRIVSTTNLAEEGIQVSLSDFAVTPTVAANTQAVRIAPKTAASLALSVTSLDRSENYKDIWLRSKPPTCIKENDYVNMTEKEKAITENNVYFHHFYRTCPLYLVNCTTLPSRFQEDDTALCMPDQVLHLKDMPQEMSACLARELRNRDRDKEFCITMGINQQLSYTTLVTDTLQDTEGFTLTPNTTLSMINIYYTQLGMTKYYERIPTIFTWFSSLGGHMGLFLGASFITLVELLFAVVHVLRVVIAHGFKLIRRCFRQKEKDQEYQ